VREPLRDGTFELSIAWEHSYLPYDDFGAHTYKTTELYEWMMAVSGFGELTRHPRRESIHGAIVARKLPQAGSGGRERGSAPRPVKNPPRPARPPPGRMRPPPRPPPPHAPHPPHGPPPRPPPPPTP